MHHAPSEQILVDQQADFHRQFGEEEGFALYVITMLWLDRLLQLLRPFRPGKLAGSRWRGGRPLWSCGNRGGTLMVTTLLLGTL